MKYSVAAWIDEELERPRIGVLSRLSPLHRRLEQGVAGLAGQIWRGRLLDQLLMTALDGTVALADRQRVSEVIGQNLDLDVAWALDEPLQVDRAVAERRLGFRLRQRQRAQHFSFILDDTHAPATAARDRLDQQRVADLARYLPRLAQVLYRSIAAGYDGHAGLAHELPRLRFVAHQFDHVRPRTDKGHANLGANLGQVGILRQKSVPWMNGVAPGDQRRADDGRDVVVRPRRLRRADADRLIGQPHRQRLSIGIAVRHHRAHTQVVAGAQNPERDLAPVGNQNLAEQRCVSHRRLVRNAFSTRKRHGRQA